jgi:hypothetical protein
MTEDYEFGEQGRGNRWDGIGWDGVIRGLFHLRYA